MSDKEGQPLRGEPGHWRYRKDIAKGIPVKPKKVGKKKPEDIEETVSEEAEEIGPENIVYTEEEAKDLNREAQKEILSARGIKHTKKDKEADLIKKIIKSNPKE